jgi:hypothetical protein
MANASTNVILVSIVLLLAFFAISSLLLLEHMFCARESGSAKGHKIDLLHSQQITRSLAAAAALRYIMITRGVRRENVNPDRGQGESVDWCQ